MCGYFVVKSGRATTPSPFKVEANKDYISVVNIIAMQRLREATLAVTYRCNSRCSMCNIWQMDDFDELPPEQYAKLPDSLRTINVTGGEPFLRDDLVEVLRRIHNAAPLSRIVFSSNGVLTERITDSMMQIQKLHPNVGIGISVDGLGDVHDKIRGVVGGFEKAIRTVRSVKSAGIKDVRIGMTIVNGNVHQLLDVHRLSVELGVEFTTTVAHNSEMYFRKTDNEPGAATPELKSALSKIENMHLRSNSPKDWFRAYHMEGITNRNMRSSAVGKCSAASRFFFMDPRGDVYPCIVMNNVIGNIKDFNSLDDLFRVAKVSEVRSRVKSCKSDCWMVCNTRSLIMSHPGRSVAWVVKNKPKAHLSKDS